MKITLYSTPTCPTCTLLKQWLQQHKIKFTEVDVSKNAKALDMIIKKTKHMTVPVIEIDGRMIVGFDITKLKKALQIK